MRNFYGDYRSIIEAGALALAFLIGLLGVFFLPTYPGYGSGANPPYQPHVHFVDCDGYQRAQKDCKHV